MKQDKFLQELLKRAEEQQVVLHDVPVPGVFLWVGKKFGEYPWKIFIPLSVVMAIVLHLGFGKPFDEWILWLFGAL